MTESERKIEKGEYVIGIAVILAALLLCVTIYIGAGNLQSAIEKIKISAAAPAAGNCTAGTAAPTATLDKTVVEKFLTTNFLAAQGLTAKVTAVAPYGSSLSLVTVSIMNGTAVLQSGLEMYATNDGKTLMVGGQAYNTNETVPTAAETPPAQAQPVPKSDKPHAQAFVMAYCPYGLQFLKAYVPVMELLGDKADVTVDFVSYSMHGQKELEANSYIYCVQKDNKAKLTPYLRCFVETGNYTTCLATAGINGNQTASCVSALDSQYNITGLYNDKSTWLSGYYPQYPVQATENEQYGVGGSPTFVLNGQEASPNRTPESIKEAICASFTVPPAECNTTLSASAEGAGLGAIGGSTQAAASATGGCG